MLIKALCTHESVALIDIPPHTPTHPASHPTRRTRHTRHTRHTRSSNGGNRIVTTVTESSGSCQHARISITGRPKGRPKGRRKGRWPATKRIHLKRIHLNGSFAVYGKVPESRECATA